MIFLSVLQDAQNVLLNYPMRRCKFHQKITFRLQAVQYCHGGISVGSSDRSHMHLIHIISSSCPSVDECYTCNHVPASYYFLHMLSLWNSSGLRLIASDLPVSQSLVDGGWSEWGPWGICTDESGAGRRKRERMCDNPPPAFGGHDCPGSPIQTEPCEQCEFQMNPDGKISLKCKCSVRNMTTHKTNCPRVA